MNQNINMARNKPRINFKIEQKFIKDALESDVFVLKASENSPQDGFTIIDELKAKKEISLKDGCVLVTDDHKAINLALSIGLKPKTSEVILLDLFKKSVIDYESFVKSFDELALIKALKPEIVKFFYKKAKEIIKNNINNSTEEIK